MAGESKGRGPVGPADDVGNAPGGDDLVPGAKSRGANPTVRRRSLGARLRDIREKAGVTADEAALALDVHSSTIYRIERGKVGIKPRDVKTLLSRYGIDDEEQLGELEGLAREGRQRGWWAKYSDTISPPYATYIGLESEANYLYIYDAIIINGLLQTREYAESSFKFAPAGDPKQISTRIQLRIDRQERLRLLKEGAELRDQSDDEPTGQSRPLQLWAVIDEAALRRMIGGKEVMEQQLSHLIEIAQYDGVTLQVLPFDGGAYPGMLGTFTILRFAGADPDVVYIEGKTGDVYEETEEQVRPYWQIFDSLRAAALSPVDTLERLRQRLRDVKDGVPDL